MEPGNRRRPAHAGVQRAAGVVLAGEVLGAHAGLARPPVVPLRHPLGGGARPSLCRARVIGWAAARLETSSAGVARSRSRRGVPTPGHRTTVGVPVLQAQRAGQLSSPPRRRRYCCWRAAPAPYFISAYRRSRCPVTSAISAHVAPASRAAATAARTWSLAPNPVAHATRSSGSAGASRSTVSAASTTPRWRACSSSSGPGTCTTPMVVVSTCYDSYRASRHNQH